MPHSVHPLIEARRDQMFPVSSRKTSNGCRGSASADPMRPANAWLRPARLRGAFVILRGRVDVMQRGTEGHPELIVTHGPGPFMGELAQLSDRPSLVDADALEAVEALVIRSRRLRDLLVEEADLGERIMRALILRAVCFSMPTRRGRSSSAGR